MTSYELRPIGRVSSSLTDRGTAPRQGDEGAPESELVFTPDVAEGLRSITAGTELIVLTWLHQGDRSTLSVHPRGDRERPLEGVFTTRSPDRPNPIGLHRVTVVAVDGPRLRVSGLEAIDGTPVVDLKPVLGDPADR
jgi:tRNA-Thr(GGU) m(6)t(6)A37 methyltransferase TsaA